MEQNKNLSTESNKTTGNNPSKPGSAQGQTSTGTSDTQSTGAQAATATQRALDNAQNAYEQTKQVVGDAYGKTTEVLNNTYEQAMTYGRENPGKLTLIAFGAGIGIGVLLASGFGGRSRTSRIAEPIVGALSQVAMEFFR
jgi:ElaB/YqjD/DUF883 family membrane-anchored ribosome-binding protein